MPEFPPHEWHKEYPEKFIVVRRCSICGRQDAKHVLLGEWDHESGPLQCKMERDWGAMPRHNDK